MTRVIRAVAIATLLAGWTLPATAQDATAAAGEKLYASSRCSLCHAVAGKGNAKHPLDGMGAKLSAADIKLWLTDPKAAEAKAGIKAKPPMKSFAALPPADIDALVAYVLTLK